jgi:hypothetical protein
LDYIEYINHRLQLYPELKPLLVKVMHIIDKRGCVPKQITLCPCSEVEHFNLMQLFTPLALKTRNHKFVFMPAKMAMVGIAVKPWLSAAAKIVGDAQTKPQTDTAEMLLERLNMLFAEHSTALEFLRSKHSVIKRKITQNGYDKTFAHYKLLMQAVAFLKKNNNILSVSDLGVELCNDSKAFRAGTACFNSITELIAAELDCPQHEALAKCGITDNQTAITVTVFGPFIYYRQGKRFDWIRQLWEQGEAAILNSGNLEHIDFIELAKDFTMPVLSCENESPFNQLMRDKAQQALIYSAGFPNSAVKKFISLLNAELELLHWGDTDPEGLEIAAILHQIKSLHLYRCGAGEIERLHHSLIPLSKKKIKRAYKLLNNPAFEFNEVLNLTLNYNGWLEQESWKPEQSRLRRNIEHSTSNIE